MSKQAVSLAAIAALIVAMGCNGTERGVLDPTPLGTGPTTSSARINPSFLGVQPVAQPFCPSVPPFVGSLSLEVQASGHVDVLLNEVRMTFIDSFGITAPPVTLPAPALTRQFGSTLIEARSQRAFPFTFPIGCFTRRAGTLVIVVVIVDDRGREEILEARASVR